MRKFYLLLFLLAAITVFVFFQPKIRNESKINQSTENNVKVDSLSLAAKALLPPISNALDRITKKPFGIKISPTSSPVLPERFSGFHTGVDFETFIDEQNTDVAIFAICDGTVLEKRFISGYGGVLVQGCVLENQDVTVIYGHLKLASISIDQGGRITVGERMGILGKGQSLETDGERKHLHLGIHKGKASNLKGYVSNQSDLKDWIDAKTYF